MNRCISIVSFILVGLLALLYPFHTVISTIGGNINISLGDPIVGITLLLFILGFFSVYFIPRYTLFILGFIITSYIGLTFYILFTPPWGIQVSTGFLELIKTLAAVFWMFAIFILLSENHKKRLDFFFIVIFLIGMVFIIHTIVLSVLYEVQRPSGPFENPNIFANYLLFVLSIQLYLYKRTIKQNVKIFMLIIILMTVLALFITGSRGAIIGIIGSLFISGLFIIGINASSVKQNLKKLLIAFPIFFAIFASLFSQTASFNRLSATSSGQVRNLDIRIQLWSTAIDAFTTNPIFGVGIGQFPQYAKYTGLAREIFPHNTFLRLASETGLIGLAFFVSIFIFSIRDAVRNNIYYRDTISLYLAGFILATLGQSLVTDIERFRSLWLAFGIIAARTYYLNINSDSHEDKSHLNEGAVR